MIGVSALKMVVSLKLVEEEGLVEAVNAELPADIRMHTVLRVTKERQLFSQPFFTCTMYIVHIMYLFIIEGLSNQLFFDV